MVVLKYSSQTTRSLRFVRLNVNVVPPSPILWTLREDLAQFLFTVGENSFDIWPDKQTVDQKVEEHGITNVIMYQRTGVLFFESMLVNP